MATTTATADGGVRLTWTANGKTETNGPATATGDGDAEPKRYSGKEHKFARQPATRINVGFFGYLPYYTLLVGVLLWHRTATAERFWTYLSTRYTRFEVSFYGSLLITTSVYWTIGFVFMAFDLIEPLHKLIRKWKVQPEARPTWATYKEVIRIAGRNLLFVNIPVALVTSLVNPFRIDVPLPSALETCTTFFTTLIFEEVGFYCVHRIFHTKRFYVKVHKLHHKWTAPVALSATYATVIEHFFSNLFPVMIPFYLTNAHFSCAMTFFAALLMDTLFTHCGYNIPGLINALKHDWHHYAYKENYGPLGWVDTVMGTNTTFNAWLAELKLRDGENWLRNGRVELAEKTQ